MARARGAAPKRRRPAGQPPAPGRASASDRASAPGSTSAPSRASAPGGASALDPAPDAQRAAAAERATPAALAADLSAAARECGVELPPRTSEQLLAYLALLEKWNAVYNLTAIRDRDQMLVQHLYDSLAIVAPLRARGLLAPRARVLDAGSGAGLPGVVLAAVQPDAQVHCVDAVAKKAAFVNQVAGELALANLRAHHARLETMRCGPGEALPAATLIVSRAFASLAQFVALTAHLLAPGGHWAAMKGRVPHDELAELPPEVSLAATITLRVPRLDAQRHLLLLHRR